MPYCSKCDGNRQTCMNVTLPDHGNTPSPPVRVNATDADRQFFNSVDNDVDRILRQEKMQEEYKKARTCLQISPLSNCVHYW